MRTIFGTTYVQSKWWSFIKDKIGVENEGNFNLDLEIYEKTCSNVPQARLRLSSTSDKSHF